jgi:hypothetical protein
MAARLSALRAGRALPPAFFLEICEVNKKMFKQNQSNTLILYGFETWSLTLREKRRMRVFENRGLKRILRLHYQNRTVKAV